MTGQETIDDIVRDFRKVMNQEISVVGTDWPTHTPDEGESCDDYEQRKVEE